MGKQLINFKHRRDNIGDVLFLLEETGARIAEVLEIAWYDIKDDQRFILRGKKGSRDRFVTITEPMKILGWAKENKMNPFSDTNYWMVYRYLKRLGIGITFPGNKNAVVTHIYRYQQINELVDSDMSISDTAAAIGHKKKKNTKRYVKKTKRKTKTKAK